MTPVDPPKTHSVDELLEQALGRHGVGRTEEAETLARRVLAMEPANVTALQLIGVIAGETGRYEEADRLLAQALAIIPDVAEAHNCRGMALQKLGRAEDALACFDRAIEIDPGFAEAANNRGAALMSLERHSEAIELYNALLAVAPEYIEARYNRATALLYSNRFRLALADFEHVLEHAPHFADAHYNRGLVLTSLGRFEDALTSYDAALAINPSYLDALGNRGLVLQTINRHEEAARDYAELARLSSSGNDQTYLDAVCQIFYAQTQCCDWSDYEASARRIAEIAEAATHPLQPFSFIFHSKSPEVELRSARNYVKKHYPASATPLWSGEHYAHDRIRVAYLSSDFRKHAVAYLTAELFELHDKTRFETYGISFWPDDKSDVRARIVRSFDHFIDVVERTDHDIAMMLREMEIDIVVHLNGHTTPGHVPIIAYRPAPICVNFLGYPGTIGADYVDYIIADKCVVPPEWEHAYSEKVVWLPDTYQVNDSKRAIAPTCPTRQEAGLPPKGFVFCGFNRNSKITPPVFDAWMRLLKRLDGSVLWLFENNAAAARNLQNEARKRGVNPERLVFAPFQNLPEHLARHALADLFIDTLPYNAHTTASDALWAGLPVVTCTGNTFASRVAASLLHAVGLPELITTSLEDYEALAYKLATTPELLATMKEKLARNRLTTPLFDTQRFCNHLETAYVEMWQRHQEGLTPASFEVAPMN